MKNILKRTSAVFAIVMIVFQYGSVFAYSKDETVFSNIDSNGNIIYTTVNNKLSLKENESNIEDNTKLKEILNLNGEETFTLKGNLLQWDSASKDIFYSGKTEQVLPISIDIKYFLNGKEIKPAEAEGKSGEVKISLNFKNNLKNKVIINGKTTILYTPFVVAVGAILSNNENSNVEITNGKTIDTGTKCMMAGIASPGLYESLNIEDFKNFNKIDITFKTSNFKNSTNIYIVATPKLIEEADLSIFDKMDELTDSIDKLQTNMNKIQEGANELKEGVSSLNDGVKELKEGAGSLNKGANDLSNGVDKLSGSLKEVVEAVESLDTGALNLDDGLKQIIKEIEKSQKMFTSKETQESMKQIEALISQNSAVINKIETAYKTYGLSNLSIDQIMALPNYDNATKASLITAKSNYESGLVELLKGNNNAITSLKGNITTITTSLQTLKEALEEAESGSSKLSMGLSKLKSGISQIYSGSKTLNTGAKQLSEGTSNLNTGVKTLSNGTNKLNTGVKELAKGITTYNKEGINKLSSYSYKLSEYSEKINKLVKLSENYEGFACNNANVTIFMYKVDSVK